MNGTERVMDESSCLAMSESKPATHEECNVHECPQWYEGPWSQVGHSL